MAAWPATLPQIPTLDGFQEQKADITLRSPMDAGPPKVRPLYTAAPTDLTISLVLDTTQRATLETFFETTLGFGTDSFDWVHPITLSAATMQFTNRPGYSAVGADYWRTVLQLRIWP